MEDKPSDRETRAALRQLEKEGKIVSFKGSDGQTYFQQADDQEEGWQPIASAPNHLLVETRIEDSNGAMVHQLLRRRDRQWLLPDGLSHVYYTPTHWRPHGAR